MTLVALVAAYSGGAGQLRQEVESLEKNKLDKVEYQKDQNELARQLNSQLNTLGSDIKVMRAVLCENGKKC